MELFACKPGPGWQLRPNPDFWFMVDVAYWIYILAPLVSCVLLVLGRRYWYFPLLLFVGSVGNWVINLFNDAFSACRSEDMGYWALVSATVGVNIFATHSYLAFRPYWKGETPLDAKADYQD